MIKSLVLAASLIVLPVAGQSAVMQATWTGTITSGYDQTDTFGTGNTDLSGLTYSMNFKFNTSRGVRVTDGSTFDQLAGGLDYFGTPSSPVLSASIQINGKTRSSKGANQGYVYTQDANTYGYNYYLNSAYDYSTQSNGSSKYNYLYGYFYDYLLNTLLTTPGTLDQPFSLANGGSTYCTDYLGYCGFFQFYDYNAVIGDFRTYTFGYLDVSNITVTEISPSAVPLPATAFMLMGGVAGLGLIRRRKARGTA
jgi:hypothetical protein